MSPELVWSGRWLFVVLPTLANPIRTIKTNTKLSKWIRQTFIQGIVWSPADRVLTQSLTTVLCMFTRLHLFCVSSQGYFCVCSQGYICFVYVHKVTSVLCEFTRLLLFCVCSQGLHLFCVCSRLHLFCVCSQGYICFVYVHKVTSVLCQFTRFHLFCVSSQGFICSV